MCGNRYQDNHAQCTSSLPDHYYITEYDSGKDKLQPHNFITIGGNFTKGQSYTLIGENDIGKQFRWLHSINISIALSFEYTKLTKSKASDHQLIINSSSSKFKITFLNGTLPTPPG